MNDERSSRMKRKRAANNFTSGDDDLPDPGNSATDGDKWSEELHRCFVEAIYDAGISQSSPSVILENMSDRPASLTSERVKSHLQKYRKNKSKSKEDFMQDYDSFMRKALTVGGGGGASHAIMPPAAMIEMMGGGKPSGGDIAAFLAYSVLTEGDVKSASGKSISSIGIAKESQDYLKNFAGTHVPFPQLTEEEKRSPLGISMVYVMGLFSSLSQHMVQERRKRFKPKHDSSSAVVLGTAAVTASTSIPVKSNSSIAPPMAFVNNSQGGPPSSLLYVQQPQQGDARVAPWANGTSALQQPNLVQLNPEAGTSTVPIAGTTGTHDLAVGGPAPRPTRGFFHPIVSKATGTTKNVNVPMGSTNWNNTVLQTPGVPVYETPLQGQTTNRNQGQRHAQNQHGTNDSGPYAQV